VKIDKDALRNSLTEEEIIDILEDLGSEDYKHHREGLMFRTICHDGDSFKLYYYAESKSFHCYTGCSETFDIYGLVQKVKDINFPESIKFVSEFVNRKPEQEEIDSSLLISDWEWIKKLKKKDKTQYEESGILDKNVLNQFIEIPHIDLINEGINWRTQKLFKIGYSVQYDRIVIPIFDQMGNLLGVKGRISKESENQIENKYLALYPYSKSQTLYGLNICFPYIDESKTVILFESEKSVIKSYQYGFKNGCAIGGKEVSGWQFKKIISLADRVILALDKDVSKEHYNKLIKMFKPYVKLEVIYDKTNMLDEKDSPVDKGLEIWKELYNKRFIIK
jgi:DNA primase